MLDLRTTIYNVGGELMVAKVKDSRGNIIGISYNPEFKFKNN